MYNRKYNIRERAIFNVQLVIPETNLPKVDNSICSTRIKRSFFQPIFHIENLGLGDMVAI